MAYFLPKGILFHYSNAQRNQVHAILKVMFLKMVPSTIHGNLGTEDKTGQEET
jgi:hypothetical protein